MHRRANGRLISFLFVVYVLHGVPHCFAQGQLSEVRESVRTPSYRKGTSEATKSKRRPRRKHCNHSYGCNCDEDNDLWYGNLFWKAAFYGVTSPVWVPVKIADDDYSSVGYFPEHPYENAQTVT